MLDPPAGPRRRQPRPAYGLVVGPFVVGVAVTLLVAAGTRQPITLTWVLAAIMIGITLAAFAFARTLWRHEPHLVAGARLRARGGAGLAAPAAVGAGDASDAGHVGGAEAGAVAAVSMAAAPWRGKEPSHGGDDPLAHIHAVEDQGRRLRRHCVNCGTPVPLKDSNCPSCGQMQVYNCKGCQTQVRLEWAQCPECGRGLP